MRKRWKQHGHTADEDGDPKGEIALQERQDEAINAASQLLKLEPDFAPRGRAMISRYIKVDSLVDKVIEGLRKAGLADLK